jgi:hypothetical protein
MFALRSSFALIACAFALPDLQTARLAAQESQKLPQAEKIKFEQIGEIQAVKDAEHRIGGTDRIFLIEDDWELMRCSQLLPKLPKIDTKKESCLVVMSWKHAPRTLLSIESENETLIVKLAEGKPPLRETRESYPPNWFVYKLPAWKGPVRIEISGEPCFTILRGAAAIERSNEIWEEILRLHSGDRPTLPEQVRRYKKLWRDASEQEIKGRLMKDKDRMLREEVAPYYDILFRDLVDIRAKPAIPRIFALIESMGKFDKALGPASGALVGIGGPEVVEQCKAAMKSWNPRLRTTATGILATIATLDMREMAREQIQLPVRDRNTPLNSLEILRRIGFTKDDVPAMIRALEQVENIYVAKPEDRPKLDYYDGEMGTRLIFSLGELGPDAQAALPILERFTTDPRLPLTGFQKVAQEAINKIKTHDSKKSP